MPLLHSASQITNGFVDIYRVKALSLILHAFHRVEINSLLPQKAKREKKKSFVRDFQQILELGITVTMLDLHGEH